MAPLSASSSDEEEQQWQEQRRKKLQEEEVEEDGEEEANDEEEPDSDDDGTQRSALNARKRQNDAPEALKRYKRNKTGILNGTMKSPEDSSSKKPFFQRIWSEDDEIIILKGLTSFIKRGGDPFTDSIGFHRSIRKSLHFDASLSQLKLKVRKLKQKFVSKKTKIDENPARAKSHDLELHELSRNIWGGEESKRDVKTRSTGGKKDSLVGCSMSDELKLKWKKLMISENELYLKLVELGKERAQLILETLNASD